MLKSPRILKLIKQQSTRLHSVGVEMLQEKEQALSIAEQYLNHCLDELSVDYSADTKLGNALIALAKVADGRGQVEGMTVTHQIYKDLAEGDEFMMAAAKLL